MNEKITTAMNNYNKSNKRYFLPIDSLVLKTIVSNAYTTDANLASIGVCSERTIKRSINRLCNLGLVSKHYARDNAKSLELQQDTVKMFLDKYH